MKLNFIHCRNSKCINYFEDSCIPNLNGEMTIINESGECERFEFGINEGYKQGGY